MRFSVCILLYGDHASLARTCLDSVLDSGPTSEEVADFRVGLNSVSRETYDLAQKWAGIICKQTGIPVHFTMPDWAPGTPPFKYPVMRSMFASPKLAEIMMWFDDDSFVLPGNGWWKRVLDEAKQHDVMGQIWHRDMRNGQWSYIMDQPWYNAHTGFDRKFTFVQGGWWTCHSKILYEYDWPPLELEHFGGDAMFGELCKHRGFRLFNFDYGVRINDGGTGKHSGAKRRGIVNGKMLGEDYDGKSPLVVEAPFLPRKWTVKDANDR